MTLLRQNKRPNCQQILGERNMWALSLSELMREKDFGISSKEIKTIEESFHLYFIQTKLKEGIDYNSGPSPHKRMK